MEPLHDYLVSPSVMSIFQDADFAGEPGELDAREDPALDNGDDDDQEDGEEECDGENDDESNQLRMDQSLSLTLRLMVKLRRWMAMMRLRCLILTPTETSRTTNWA